MYCKWYCQYVFAEYIGNTSRQYSRCQFKRVSERVTYLRPLRPLELISWCFYGVCYNVLRALCNALGVLQGEHSAGLGYLLPTLTVVKNQLSDSNQSLAICKPLAKAVMTGTDKRFSETLNDPKCQLSALVHPMFKLVGSMMWHSSQRWQICWSGISLPVCVLNHHCQQQQQHLTTIVTHFCPAK